MADEEVKMKITAVPQESSVDTTDDFYVKIGQTFRRVPISALVTLLETSGFIKPDTDGIKQDKLAMEPVVITPDETPGTYVSSRTASQIYQSHIANFAIQPEYEYWPDENTAVVICGEVLSIEETETVLAFLDYSAATPSLMIVTVQDLNVTADIIPLTGGGSGGGVVPAPGVGDEGKVPMVVSGVVVWAAIPETTTSEIDAIIAAI